MYSAIISIPSNKSKIIVQALLPDIKNDKNNKIELIANRKKITIKVKSKKLNHLKSIIVSYIELIKTLEELE